MINKLTFLDLKTKIFFAVAAFFSLVFIAPTTVEAYAITGQNAVKVNNNTIIYQINYDLGFKNYGIKAPIDAGVSGDGGEESWLKIDYEIVNEDDELVSFGQSKAIVLSSAPVAEGEYMVEKGRLGKFTLVGIFTTSNDEEIDLNNIKLRVTTLPFTLIDDEQEFANGLNDSELKDFVSGLKL